MASLLQERTDQVLASISLRFYVAGPSEGREILDGLHKAALEFLETQGFHPEGVKMQSEVRL